MRTDHAANTYDILRHYNSQVINHRLGGVYGGNILKEKRRDNISKSDLKFAYKDAENNNTASNKKARSNESGSFNAYDFNKENTNICRDEKHMLTDEYEFDNKLSNFFKTLINGNVASYVSEWRTVKTKKVRKENNGKDNVVRIVAENGSSIFITIKQILNSKINLLEKKIVDNKMNNFNLDNTPLKQVGYQYQNIGDTPLSALRAVNPSQIQDLKQHPRKRHQLADVEEQENEDILDISDQNKTNSQQTDIFASKRLKNSEPTIFMLPNNTTPEINLSNSSGYSSNHVLNSTANNNSFQKKVIVNGRIIPPRIQHDNVRDRNSNVTVATICYSIQNDTMVRLVNAKGNLNRILSSEFEARVRGMIKDHMLYVYPGNQNDFEKICGSSSHPYHKLPRRILDSRNNTLIITKLTYKEVNESESLQNQLRNIGIVGWAPLSKGNDSFRGIKCSCSNRDTMIRILREYYLNGLKILTSQDLIIYVQVNPDVSNPIQCYHCFEFGKHLAEECKLTSPVCEKCSSKDHYVENCTWKSDEFCCLHCQGDHGVRDRVCPVFVELKIAKLNEMFTKITGQVALRPMPQIGKKIDYNQLVEKHLEATNISNCWSKFEKKSLQRIENIEVDMRGAADDYKHELDKSKNQFDDYIRMMRENNEILQRTNENISSSMQKVAVSAAKAVKDEVFSELIRTNSIVETVAQSLDETVTVVDYNAKVISERITTIEKWMSNVEANTEGKKFIPTHGSIKLVSENNRHKPNTSLLLSQPR